MRRRTILRRMLCAVTQLSYSSNCFSSYFLATSLMLVLASSFSASGQNLVSFNSWTVGSGSIGIFQQNGTTSQNEREMGIGPYGDQVILWKGIADAANGSDGGWDTQSFSISPNKLYRFSVWIKKTGSLDGTVYLGCGYSGTLNLDGSVNTNPYFFAGDLPELNKWYLLVGYVHPSNDPSTQSYGGIYDGVTGAKVASITDYKFAANATVSIHRTYMYYSTTTTDRQYFYAPSVYEMSSNTPVSETVGALNINANASFSQNVGIGTISPIGDLHIHSSEAELYLTSNTYGAVRGNGGTWLFGYNGPIGSEDISIGTQNGTGSRTLTFAAGGQARVKVLSNGFVGIGTSNPTQPLTVNGTIYGKEVKVNLNVPGPDYVFESNYELMSLQEVAAYVRQHKHLPEVPPAKEMEENGINVSDMNMILLKKVEELTLHLIEQQRRIEILEKELTKSRK